MTESRLVLPRLGEMKAGWEATAKGYEVSLGDNKNVLKLIVELKAIKQVNCMTSKLYLNKILIKTLQRICTILY